MTLKILIVDDDKKLLSVMKNIFTEEGHEVDICSDGLNAINMCREQKYDLIITDLMMPGANGLEVLKATRKIDPSTIVILVTGFASLETAIEAIREGAYDYITKPFKLEEIKILVSNAWEKIRLIHENQRLIDELQEAYKQLNMLKKIMGVGENDNDLIRDRSDSSHDSDGPIIAGSMLPLYYSENITGVNPPALSDLERISTLKEKGFLSEEEFGLCKSKLFKNIKH